MIHFDPKNIIAMMGDKIKIEIFYNFISFNQQESFLHVLTWFAFVSFVNMSLT